MGKGGWGEMVGWGGVNLGIRLLGRPPCGITRRANAASAGRSGLWMKLVTFQKSRTLPAHSDRNITSALEKLEGKGRGLASFLPVLP